MPITSIAPEMIAPEGLSFEAFKPEVKGDSFAKTLEKSIGEVNELLKGADKKMEALATGDGENIHDAMIAFEKAETALKLMVQVRNKALDAYNSILQMQV